MTRERHRNGQLFGFIPNLLEPCYSFLCETYRGIKIFLDNCGHHSLLFSKNIEQILYYKLLILCSTEKKKSHMG